MINISPIFGQSRAKKKEIIDSKIAKEEFIKTDHEVLFKSVRLRYLPKRKGWIYRRG
jgi:DNA primase large subunit